MAWLGRGDRGGGAGGERERAGVDAVSRAEWNGHRAGEGVPGRWTEQDFRWRVRIDGDSHSQPVIWGERLFLLTAMEAGKERALLCLNKADGKEVWRKSYTQPTHRPGNRNSGYANSSAVVDADRV